MHFILAPLLQPPLSLLSPVTSCPQIYLSSADFFQYPLFQKYVKDLLECIAHGTLVSET